MSKLGRDFHLMCKHNKDGSHQTQRDRYNQLQMSAKQLEEGGYRGIATSGLGTRHVEYLIDLWKEKGISHDTIANRLSNLRWMAGKINKKNIVQKTNGEYGLVTKSSIPTENKAFDLTADQLDKIPSEHLKVSLVLEREFGLRRVEAMKFRPSEADKGDHLSLTGSWCKNGRPREIPILKESQREILIKAHELVGNRSLIPAQKYVTHLKTYERQLPKAGIHNAHGLRYAYAQERYLDLTGWKAPLAGGPRQKDLSPEDKVKDREARQIISRELGHNRISITNRYLGK